MPRTSYALKTFGSSIPGDPSGRGGSFVPTLPSENRAARTGRRDHSAIALPRTMCRMERKLATVLFVDLVDSTTRLAGRDPEVVRRQVTSFFDRAVEAHRAVCATDLGRPLRSLAAPLVGRDAELELLENTFSRTVRDERATLVTIYGDPGVGKSRLVREFVAGLDRALVLS